jgi:acetyl esterase/lipase
MFRKWLAVGIFMSVLFGLAHAQELPERDAPDGELAQPIVYQVDGMADVGVVSDVVYKVADDEALVFDVYTPVEEAPEAGYPLVIITAGDTPPPPFTLPKDWRVYQDWGRLMAASGMVAVVGGHRIAVPQPANRANALEDIQDMIAYVRDHASEYNINPDKLCIMAFSAQVPPAMVAALQGTPDYVACAVAYYGVMELPGNVYKPYSPVNFIETEPVEELPSILLAKAGFDAARINFSIEKFVEIAEERGADLTLLEHPEGQHAFDLRDDDDTSRAIMADTIAFLQAHLME